MRKLKLNLEALAITTFDTDAAPAQARGTVQGHYNIPANSANCETALASCDYSACPNIYNTCGYSCNCVTDTDNVVFCH
jgi:hypothetical protein